MLLRLLVTCVRDIFHAEFSHA